MIYKILLRYSGTYSHQNIRKKNIMQSAVTMENNNIGDCKDL